MVDRLPWNEYRDLVRKISNAPIGLVQIRSAWRRGLSPLHCMDEYKRIQRGIK